MNVGLTAIDAVNRLIGEAEHGRLGLARRGSSWTRSNTGHRNTRWLVVAALGLTAAA